MKKCPSGKVMYFSRALAEDALLEAWIRNHYKSGQGPVNIYTCDDCGNFHFTSKGEMSEQLKKALDSGQIEKSRRAFDLENKLKRR
jgi:hypothetical protein